MAFLDNSGDIILDAVLTDEGRRRLAKGDGSFKIVKFALGDDEIDYGLYDPNNVSGSAYYDLNLLKTPILEAFTNNAASMNSKLITIPRTNLLYLPIVKLNTVEPGSKQSNLASYTNSFFVLVETGSETSTVFKNNTHTVGALSVSSANIIRIDQGIDTTELSYTNTLKSQAPDLLETEYEISIDNRLGFIADKNKMAQTYNSIDDDNIAYYNFALGIDGTLVTEGGNTAYPAGTQTETIAGPRGTRLEFVVLPNIDLIGGNYLFDLLGTTVTDLVGSGTGTFKIVRTSVNVYGVNTGYQIDIPITFVKKVS
jgi:hypothetical protein